MKIRIVVLFCALSLLAGCYQKARLYPVQGPLAAQAPSPVFTAKVSGVWNSGNMTVTLAGGEVCKGTWGMVNRMPADAGTTATVDWAKVWDTVYGQGFYTANVLGTPLHIRSTLSGSKGTTLNAEMYRRDIPGQLTEAKGVAEDSDGNIYKIVM